MEWKVEGSVRDAQGEETEDEDQTLEERARKVQDTKKVRIVECLLRLDE